MSNRIERRVVEKVLDMMEDGEELPWHHNFVAERGVNSLPFNIVSELPFHGFTVINLWLAMLAKGYKSHGWMTSKGAFNLRGEIDVNTEEGVECFFYKECATESSGVDSSANYERTFFTLYNLEQAKHVQYTPAPVANVVPFKTSLWDSEQLVAMTDAVSKRSGLKVQYGSASARYSKSDDTLFVDASENDRDDPFFAKRLAKGLIHATACDSRTGRLARCVARRDGTNHGKSGFERLVADIGVAFLSSEFGVPIEPDILIDDLDRWMIAIESRPEFFTLAVNEAKIATQYVVNQVQGKRKRRLPSESIRGSSQVA